MRGCLSNKKKRLPKEIFSSRWTWFCLLHQRVGLLDHLLQARFRRDVAAHDRTDNVALVRQMRTESPPG